MSRSVRPLKDLPTGQYGTARWALSGKPGVIELARWTVTPAQSRRLFTLPVGWTNADAEPRPVNAEARRAIVVAVVVVSPRTIITLPDDHATITPGIPALAGVVTNQSYLLKQ